jgi:Ni,Fe-hydrogenase I small subunit
MPYNEDPFGPAVTEINLLDEPNGRCQWGKGCSAPATHNVCQYDGFTAEALVEGVEANYCRAHAIAMNARLDEWE